jgi:hypothetical protein
VAQKLRSFPALARNHGISTCITGTSGYLPPGLVSNQSAGNTATHVKMMTVQLFGPRQRQLTGKLESKTKALATLADLTGRVQMHQPCLRWLNAFQSTLIDTGVGVHKEGQG